MQARDTTRRLGLLSTLATCLAAGIAPAGGGAAGSGDVEGKPVFDASNFYSGKDVATGTRVTAEGAAPIVWVPGYKFGLHNKTTRFDETRLRTLAREWAATDPNSVVMINVEHIPVENVRRHPHANETKIQEGHDILGRIMDIIHEESPGLVVGLFDMFPPQHLQAWKPGHPEHNRFKKALERCFFRKDPKTGQMQQDQGLADKVDVIFPAMYIHPSRIALFERDRKAGIPDDRNRGLKLIDEWVNVTVAAARRTGKPVFPVVWHRMHAAPSFDARGFDKRVYVGDELFGYMIDRVLEHADGVVFWTAPEAFKADDPWHDLVAEAVTEMGTPDMPEPGPRQQGSNESSSAGGSSSTQGAVTLKPAEEAGGSSSVKTVRRADAGQQ